MNFIWNFFGPSNKEEKKKPEESINKNSYRYEENKRREEDENIYNIKKSETHDDDLPEIIEEIKKDTNEIPYSYTTKNINIENKKKKKEEIINEKKEDDTFEVISKEKSGEISDEIKLFKIEEEQDEKKPIISEQKPEEKDEIIMEKIVEEKSDIIIEKKPEEKDENIIEQEIEEKKESIIEEKPIEKNEIIIEQKIEEKNDIEEKPEERNEIIIEEKPEQSHQIILEEKPEEKNIIILEEKKYTEENIEKNDGTEEKTEINNDSGAKKGKKKKGKKGKKHKKDKSKEALLNNTEDKTFIVDKEDPKHWKTIISGPTDTPYENGKFEVSINFDEDKNIKPIINFLTKIYHYNIEQKDGKVLCPFIWNLSNDENDNLKNLEKILITPDYRYPCSKFIKDEYYNNYANYKEKAKNFTENYALN